MNESTGLTAEEADKLKKTHETAPSLPGKAGATGK